MRRFLNLTRRSGTAARRPWRVLGVLGTSLALVAGLCTALVTVAGPAHADAWLYRNYDVYNFAPFPLTEYEHWQQDPGALGNWWKQEPVDHEVVRSGHKQSWSINTPSLTSYPHYYVNYTFTDNLNIDPATGKTGTSYELTIWDDGYAYGQTHCRVIKWDNGWNASNDVSGTASGPWTCGIGYEDYNATSRDYDRPVLNATQTMVIDLLPTGHGSDSNPATWSPTAASANSVPASAVADVIGACADAPTTTNYVAGDGPGTTGPGPAPSTLIAKRATCTANNAKHLPQSTFNMPFGGPLSACPYGESVSRDITSTRKVEAAVANEESVTASSELEFGDLTFAVSYAHAFSRSYTAGAELSGGIDLTASPGTQAQLTWSTPVDSASADWVVQLGGMKYNVSNAVGHFPTGPSGTTPIAANPDIPGFTTPPAVYVPTGGTNLDGSAGIAWGSITSGATPLTNGDYNGDKVANSSACKGPAPYLEPRPDHTDTTGASYYELPNASVGAPYSYGYAGDPMGNYLHAYGGPTKMTFKVVSGALPPGLTLSDGPVDSYGRFTAVISGTPTTQSYDSYSYYPFSIQATNDAGQTDIVNYRIIPYANALATTRITPASVSPAPTIGSAFSMQFHADGCCTFVDNGGSLVGRTPNIAVSSADAAKLDSHNLALDADGTLHTKPGTNVVGPPATIAVTLQVANVLNAGGLFSKVVTIPIDGAQITSAPVSKTIVVNQPYSFTPTGVVNPGPGRWVLAGATTLGQTPPGLSINSSTGVLSGPVTAVGSYAFAICLYPAGSSAGACQQEQLTVGSTPTITSAAPASGAAGTAFSAQVTATGYPRPSFAATGLPAGLSINATTGVISGTPTAPTSAAGAPVKVTASNSVGSSSQTFTMRVWQSTGVTVSPTGWSGSSVVARYPGIAVVVAHSTGTTTGSRLTFTSDSAATDVALQPATAGGTILNAPTECHLGPLSNGISNGSTLVYFGATSATSAPTWQMANDASPLSTLRADIDPQRLLGPSALAGCVADPTRAATRIVATNPGTTTLYWADVAGGSTAPTWHALDTPPVAPGIAGTGVIHGAPSLASRATGEYDLAVAGQDGTTWVRHYTPAAGWGGWTSLGGVATSGVSITSESATNLQVTQRGTDGALYVDTLNGTAWSGWSRVAGPTLAANTAPAAVSLGGGQTDVVVLGSDNKVYRVHLT